MSNIKFCVTKRQFPRYQRCLPAAQKDNIYILSVCPKLLSRDARWTQDHTGEHTLYNERIQLKVIMIHSFSVLLVFNTEMAQAEDFPFMSETMFQRTSLWFWCCCQFIPGKKQTKKKKQRRKGKLMWIAVVAEHTELHTQYRMSNLINTNERKDGGKGISLPI